MLSQQQLGQAAFLEAALRRLVPGNAWARATHDPPLAELFELRGKGKVSKEDIIENKHVLRALLETFPDRVPECQAVAKGLLLVDKYFSYELFRDSDKHNQALTLAFRCKLLVGAIRRLFRRSRKSRCCHTYCTLKCCAWGERL